MHGTLSFFSVSNEKNRLLIIALGFSVKILEEAYH